MSLRTSQVLRRTAPVLLLGLFASGQVAAAADGPIDKARASLERGDLTSARIELKNILQDDPGDTEARLLLGEMYLKVGNGPAAEKEFRRAQELGVPPSDWRLPLVRALILQGNHADALARLEGMVDLPPDQQAGVWAQRGNAQLGLERPEQAKASFETALKLNPEEGVATLGLIRLALRAGDEARAVELTNEFLGRRPDDADGLLIRSELLRSTGKTEAAARGFARVTEVDPSNLRGYLGHATTMIELQRFDEAVKDLDAAGAIQPNVLMVHYLRGIMDFQNENWDEAANHLQTVLKALPSHLPSKLMMGMIRYTQEDFEIADEHLGTVVNAMPDNLTGAQDPRRNPDQDA